MLTARDSAKWWVEFAELLECSSAPQRERYARTLGLRYDDEESEERARERFVRAFEERNERVTRWFADRGEQHRLVVLEDLTSVTEPAPVWTTLCNFLEAWSSCPVTKPIPGARKRKQLDAASAVTVSKCAGYGPSMLSAGSSSYGLGFFNRTRTVATSRGSKLRAYKQRDSGVPTTTGRD